jgi:hypothetical protein
VPSIRTSLPSRTSSATRTSGQNWCDSTISALDKIVDNEEEGNVGFTKGSKMYGTKISGPIAGSFVHVDGAFVDQNVQPSVFGNVQDDEQIGRAS